MAACAWLVAVAPVFAQGNPPPSPGRVYSAAALDERPRLQNPAEIQRWIVARYPPAMVQRRTAGQVAVRFRILENGSVDSASVVPIAVSDTAFTAPGTAVARRLRFTRPEVRRQPVTAWHTYELRFIPPPAARPGITDGSGGPAPDGTYALSALDQQPTLLNGAEMERRISALYPSALLDTRVGGTVVLNFRIQASGIADSSSVTVEEATHPAFVEPAMIILREMRFAPARVGGRPVPVWVMIPIYFSYMRSPSERKLPGRP